MITSSKGFLCMIAVQVYPLSLVFLLAQTQTLGVNFHFDILCPSS